jgi:hypothetical protein
MSGEGKMGALRSNIMTMRISVGIVFPRLRLQLHVLGSSTLSFNGSSTSVAPLKEPRIPLNPALELGPPRLERL